MRRKRSTKKGRVLCGPSSVRSMFAREIAASMAARAGDSPSLRRARHAQTIECKTEQTKLPSGSSPLQDSMSAQIGISLPAVNSAKSADGTIASFRCDAEFGRCRGIADMAGLAGAPTPSRMAQTGGQRTGRACPLCPGISDINLFRYCQGVIDLDAEILDRAFDLGMTEQKLDSPEIARPAVDQGSFRASQ